MSDDINQDARAAAVWRFSLAEYGRGLRDGKLTAEATLRSLLARIRDHAALDAFTFVDADAAIAAARGVDELLAGRTDLGPLMGVPIAVKDLYAVEGMPLTAGSRVDVSDVAPAEGTMVRALKRAGADHPRQDAYDGIRLRHLQPLAPDAAQSLRRARASHAGRILRRLGGRTGRGTLRDRLWLRTPADRCASRRPFAASPASRQGRAAADGRRVSALAHVRQSRLVRARRRRPRRSCGRCCRATTCRRRDRSIA